MKGLVRMKIKMFITTFALFLFNTIIVFAQPTNPCDDPTVDPDDLPPGICDVPLDNWVYVLVIAAVIYGVYKLYQKQKAFAL
ncbi:hypothetical protein EWM62_08855 [Mucilaginibacter terrigena]|uniref:Signal peptidase n=1 Tax=Mucilaginibacter terrigena TaxID=2492395 RepID=A0A4Q5LN17_9SPHI|nr:hypothetical protein [Mucilaginibacter terrigena]RYU90743.1 hypothetical protein EWM62_08855 [Mucilaginibacter terrigena]